MSYQREMRELAREYAGKGWNVTKTGSSHLRFQAPCGIIIFTSSTPRSDCGVRKARHDLKKVEEGRW